MYPPRHGARVCRQNRGRGQVYPSGEKSNNTIFTSTASGQITSIEPGEKGKTILTVQSASGDTVTQTVPAGLTVSVKVKDVINESCSST